MIFTGSAGGSAAAAVKQIKPAKTAVTKAGRKEGEYGKEAVLFIAVSPRLGVFLVGFRENRKTTCPVHCNPANRFFQ